MQNPLPLCCVIEHCMLPSAKQRLFRWCLPPSGRAATSLVGPRYVISEQDRLPLLSYKSPYRQSKQPLQLLRWLLITAGKPVQSSRSKSRLGRPRASSLDAADMGLDPTALAEDPLYDPSELSPAVQNTLAPRAQPQGKSSSSNLVCFLSCR